MAEQPEFRPPNFTIQEASQYKADIDSSVALLGRIGAAFAPHEKPSIAEISEVTTIADVSGNLDGAWFTINAPSQGFYVWFNATDVSGTLDPGLSGLTGIQVDFTTDDSASTIAAALNTAVDAQALFNSSVASDIVTISSRDQGAVTDLADGLSGNATGFGLAVTVQGGDGPNDLTIEIDAGYVIQGSIPITVNAASFSPSAPATNPRIDRVIVNLLNGEVLLVTGTEAASPNPPGISIDIPALVVCQYRLETSTTILTNSLITDERSAVRTGSGILNQLGVVSTRAGVTGSLLFTAIPNDTLRAIKQRAVRVIAFGTKSGTAATVTLEWRISGPTTVFSITMGANVTRWHTELVITPWNDTNSYFSFTYIDDDGTPQVLVDNKLQAITVTSDDSIFLFVSSINGADTIVQNGAVGFAIQ